MRQGSLRLSEEMGATDCRSKKKRNMSNISEISLGRWLGAWALGARLYDGEHTMVTIKYIV